MIATNAMLNAHFDDIICDGDPTWMGLNKQN